jgi:hypothetical protein
MKDETLKRRIAAAKSLDRKLQVIWKNLGRIPSYTGKARFMDKVIAASREAQVLAQNLKLDWAYRSNSNEYTAH